MYPHPNKLPRWLYWLLFVSGGLLLSTGLGWEALHYLLGAGRNELALPHAGEGWLMRLHGLAVIGFSLALGGLGTVHIPRGWRERRNKPSGVTLISLMLALLASGYALYYWTGDASREVVGLLHTALGLLAAILLQLHRVARIEAAQVRERGALTLPP